MLPPVYELLREGPKDKGSLMLRQSVPYDSLHREGGHQFVSPPLYHAVTRFFAAIVLFLLPLKSEVPKRVEG